MKKRIVFCDDHPIINDALSQMLEKEQMLCVGKFTSTELLEQYFQHAEADVLVCDLNIDKRDTFTILADIRKRHPKLNIILFSAYGESAYIKRAKQIGVQSFIVKDTSYDIIREVILSPTDTFFTNADEHGELAPRTIGDANNLVKFRLSEREKTIIRHVLDGKTSEEISRVLFISKLTVDTHRKNIHKKIGVSGVLHLHEFAKTYGII